MDCDHRHLILNNGTKMPMVGIGTYMGTLEPDVQTTVEMVCSAVDVGYRHIDTASLYNTEPMVGKAIARKIQEGVVTRDDLFVVTKVWCNSFRRGDVLPSLRRSLERLQLPSVDLFLMHWPYAFKSGENPYPRDETGKVIYDNVDHLETWRAMEECVDLGLTKSIGLSNFNCKQIQRILDKCRIPPASHQVESHPYLNPSKTIEFCQKNGIAVTAYAPLFGNKPAKRKEKNWPTIFTDETIREIADRHNKSVAQVCLRYQLQRGIAVIPKSLRPERQAENLASLEFSLSTDDVKRLQSCHRNLRMCGAYKDHPEYPFHED